MHALSTHVKARRMPHASKPRPGRLWLSCLELHMFAEKPFLYINLHSLALYYISFLPFPHHQQQLPSS